MDRLQDLRSRLAPVFDVYRAIELGQVSVFAATEIATDNPVRLTVLSGEAAAKVDPKRFVATLTGTPVPDHPSFVRRYSAAATGGLIYLVEAETPGVSVADKLRAHGPAPLDEIVRVLREVADALVVARHAGTVHGYLAPHNVLMVGGTIKLTECGMVPALRVAVVQPGDGMDAFVNVPAFLAPEQREGRPATAQSDVYGLGMLAYAMLTGRAEGEIGVPDHQAVRSEMRTRGVPAAVADLVTRGLCASPGDRTLGADEVLRSLKQAAVPPRRPDPARLSDRVGPYRLIQRYGEGGMGTVYLAHQRQPVERTVALKIIKPGMDTAEVIARFETERQAMASMNHPNIAHVYDAGSTNTGRPYFAMELIRGIPITTYCDTHHASVRERIELFVPVCRAVQHAHHKGIIHRDLKPSNVLVTVEEGRPKPKIIDFGVAKAVGQRLRSRPFETRVGQMVGTPEYMSPEQREGSQLDVDARADVYSLGIMLYELLSGMLPSDSSPKSLDPDAIRRLMRETDPPRLSVRFHGAGTRQEDIARQRSTDVAGLGRALSSDLEWIVMKAMERDRTRRYETATDLARDLERHLENEPVLARPPTTAYRAQKFVRRHRAGVMAVVVALLALFATLATTTTLLVRARAAERSEATAAATAQQVSQFLEGLFTLADPGETEGRRVTAMELLDKGAVAIQRDLKDQPAIQRPLLQAMGRAYQGLGQYDRAAELVEQAIALPSLSDAGDVGGLYVDLGNIYLLSGRLDEAEQAGRHALDILEREHGPDRPEVAVALYALSQTYERAGRYDESLSLIRRVVRIDEHTLAPDDPARAKGLSQLGIALFEHGQLDSAMVLIERSVRIRTAAHGPVHPDIAMGLSHLSAIYEKAGRYVEAESLAVSSLTTWEAIHGPDHPEVAFILSNLGAQYAIQGKFAEAVPVVERALRISEKVYGPEHSEVAWNLQGLGRIHIETGDLDEAEALLLRALSIGEKALGPDHPEVGSTLRNLAALETRRARLERAETYQQRAISIFRGALGPEHMVVAETLHELANLRVSQDRIADAERLFEEALDIQRAQLPGGHPELEATIEDYAALLERLGKHARAAELRNGESYR